MPRPAGEQQLSHSAPLVNDPQRVPKLRPVNKPRRQRPLSIQRSAELAADGVRCVDVDPLADQWSAATVGTTFAPGRERIDAAAQ